MLKHQNLKQTIFIYVLFLIVSVVAIIPFWRTGEVFGQGDLLFHLNRIEGLAEGIRNHLIPYRSFDVLTNIGSAVNFFYPFVIFLGWAKLFTIIDNPVHAFYLGEMIIHFVTFLIAYQSVLQVKKDARYKAVIFSLLYGLSMYRFYLAYDQFVLGELLAYAFLPLAFAGFYNVFIGNSKKWLALPVGLTLILYSHLLSGVIIIFIFTIIFFIKLLNTRFDVKKLNLSSIFKSIILTLFLSAIIIVPMVYQARQTPILTTAGNQIAKQTGMGQAILDSLNLIGPNIGILGLISIVLGAVQISKRNFNWNLLIWLCGTILFFMSTTLFPWSSMPEAVQSLIQFPFRIRGFATFFLMLYLSEVLISIFKAPKEMIVTLFAVAGLGSALYFTVSEQVIHDRVNQNELIPNDNYYEKRVLFETSFKANATQLKELTSSRHDYIGIMDYAPKASWPINNYYSIMTHESFVGSQSFRLKIKYLVNRVEVRVNLNAMNHVDLPFLMYGNETVMVDGKIVNPKRTNRGTIGLNISTGKHLISIGYATPKWIYSLWIFTGIIWGLIILKTIIDHFKNYKSKKSFSTEGRK